MPYSTQKSITFIVLSVTICLSSCLRMENEYDLMAPGEWRVILNLDKTPNLPLNKKAEPIALQDESEISSGLLPFNFEVIYTSDTSFKIVLKNGEERIEVEEIEFGRNRATGDDTVRVHFPHYDSYLKGIFEENIFEGYWVVNAKKNYMIPFLATQGKAHRFTQLKTKPVADLTGKWSVRFSPDAKGEYPAIGEFEQNGNDITGTFLTETGDYRFLEGTVQGDKMYLSTFDGAHAFLFEAKILVDGSLLGSFKSGSDNGEIWTAIKNDSPSLSHPDSLTVITNKSNTFNFSINNEKGETIRLTDDQFKDKVTLVQILGTWCPNCLDETKFMIDYKKNNPDLDFEIIGLAFERYKESEKAWSSINRYKEKFGVDYEILWAGSSKKSEAAKVLPDLNAIISYPSMVFVDKRGIVRKIHTGFNGPATSEYKNYTEEFDKFLKGLISE